MVRFGELIVILELRQHGMSVSAIARRTGLSRGTVRKYITRGIEPPAYGPRAPRPSLLAPYEPYLRDRIAAFRELTGSRLHREIRELGYSGGYTAVKDFLREVRPRQSTGFEVRFETPPGRQAQVDFAHFRTVFSDEPGSERILWLFSLVLGHSRMQWGHFVLHQDLQTLLRCHVAAFEALGGAPAEILYDRMRNVFRREDAENGHVIYNATLRAFAEHYQYQPKACRPYRAQTKGKVERPFRYIREDFFLGRSFRNLDDLNVQFHEWLDHVANRRVHATTRRVVAEHFAEEQSHLQALPTGPFPGGAATRSDASHPRWHDLRQWETCTACRTRQGGAWSRYTAPLARSALSRAVSSSPCILSWRDAASDALPLGTAPSRLR